MSTVMNEEAGVPAYSPLVTTSSWEHLSVEMTSKCNLRCTYCGKASDEHNARPGHDEHMSDVVNARVIELAGKFGFREINFNGTGETSFFPGWTEAIAEYRKRSKAKLYVVSNFAKVMTEEELRTFLLLNRVYVSVDTADRALLMHIRPKVDIRVIAANVIALRARALLDGTRLPWLRINCVVSDLSGPHLRELAAFAVSLGVDEIEMIPLNGVPNQADGLPRPLSTLSVDELGVVARQASEAKALLESNGKRLRVSEELRNILASVDAVWARKGEVAGKVVIDEDSEEEIFDFKRLPRDGVETRLCLQPWRRILVGADGRAYPCCRKAEVIGNLNKQSVDEIAAGEPLLSLRDALLSGHLKGTKCLGCANAPIGSVEEMRLRVGKLLGQATPVSVSTELPQVIPSRHRNIYERLDEGLFDYRTYSFETLSRLSLRGPPPEVGRTRGHVSFLGAAQTFGRFVETPFPAIVQERIGLPCLNLGLPGAGPLAFLEQPELLRLVNQGSLAVVQVLSARSSPNGYFLCDGFSNGVRREDGQPVSAMQAYEEIFSQCSPSQVEALVQEAVSNWENAFIDLLQAIKIPKILLYFSQAAARSTLDLKSRASLFGSYPQMVTRSMISRVAERADLLVEAVSSQGLPQALVHPSTGEPIVVRIGGKQTGTNTYYPSPEMHAAAAAALLPVIESILGKKTG